MPETKPEPSIEGISFLSCSRILPEWNGVAVVAVLSEHKHGGKLGCKIPHQTLENVNCSNIKGVIKEFATFYGKALL